MPWELIESPIVKARKASYKLIVKMRAAFILLLSAWRMEPRHFRPEAASIYKDLGWWVPMVPGSVYAWASQPLFAPSIVEAAPNFPVHFFSVSNSILFVFLAHLLALIDFGFHAFICRVGRVFQMREFPPPYEFFLVRTSGLLMWFAITVCFMAMAVLAQEHSTVGYIASSVMAVPLIWVPLFMFANSSWQRPGLTGKIELRKMYQSHRFASFVWRIQCGLVILSILILLLLARHPDFLVGLLLSYH